MTIRCARVPSLPIALALAAVVALAARSAAADDAKIEQVDDGYAYSFEDDPLTAHPSMASGARIKVQPGPVRRTLLRPRLHFVPEMLKSVENL